MDQSTLQQTFDQAVRLHQAGQLPEAEELYRRVLAQQPQHAGALHHLGVIAGQSGRNDVAADLIRQAVAMNPSLRGAHYNLGNALREIGQLDQAIAAYRQAIALSPDVPVVHNNLGVALTDKGQVEEAISCYRESIALDPKYAQAFVNLGNALRGKDQLDDAIAAYRQAIALSPNLAEAHYNLCIAQKSIGQLDEAIAECRQVLAINPNLPEAHSNLINTMHYHPGYDAQAIGEECRRWNRQHAEPLRKFIQVHSNDRDPDRRLRVGYVSPDFRWHTVGRNILPLIYQHDHGRFEIICYAHVSRPDALTGLLREKADGWRDIAGHSDEQVAKLIREDRIDILVDLSLHMSDNRLLVFARKPAPVQVTYLGYCSTSGMEAMDYRLSDPHMDPADFDLICYSERTIRLPHTYWCYQSTATTCESSRKNGAEITFGCLNTFAKATAEAQLLWARIARSVPGSRLMIHAPPGSPRETVRDRFASAGVDSGRLEFVPTQSYDAYMQSHCEIDIALDPFPYGGGITSLDSLWQGVPIVTLSGRTAVGRGGRSILSNLGLTDLIAQTPDEYVRIAVELAGDSDRLAELRRTLRQRMEDSPLRDAAGFARDVEAAYRQMWRNWCEAV